MDIRIGLDLSGYHLIVAYPRYPMLKATHSFSALKNQVHYSIIAIFPCEPGLKTSHYLSIHTKALLKIHLVFHNKKELQL